MRHVKQPQQPKVTYRVEVYDGAWHLQTAFDSVSRALGCYSGLTTRGRILQVWFDASHRQHCAVLRESEQDARITRATEISGAVIVDNRDWAEDDNGEPLRVAPRQMAQAR